MRHLYLLRHGKSLWNNPSDSDFTRPLSERGLRDASKIASYIKRENLPIEVVLCSPALRTTQTLEAIKPVLEKIAEVIIDDSLYTFNPVHVIERLAEVPDSKKEVMIIGHNPGIQSIALTFAPPGLQRTRISDKYPTGSLAIIGLENGSWDLSNPVITSFSFITPKEIE